jgi:hypothetical protein
MKLLNSCPFLIYSLQDFVKESILVENKKLFLGSDQMPKLKSLLNIPIKDILLSQSEFIQSLSLVNMPLIFLKNKLPRTLKNSLFSLP